MQSKLLFLVIAILSMSCQTGFRWRQGAGKCMVIKAEPGTYSTCLEHGGRKREFLLHIPPQYVPGKPMPLLLSFHGRKGTPEQQAGMTGFHELADREGFLVVEPAGVEKSWNVGICCDKAHELGVDDIGFVKKLLDELSARLAVDSKRIYATGFSNGARMANQLGCELSDRIAAIAPIAGPLTSLSCQISRPVPVFSFHGTADGCIPYKGGYGREHDIDNPPIEKMILDWAKRDGCEEKPLVSFPEKGFRQWRFQKCGGDVVFYSTEGAGHIWPGAKPYLFWRICGGKWIDSFHASEEIWSFFKAHPMAK